MNYEKQVLETLFDQTEFDADFESFAKETPGPVAAVTPDRDSKKTQITDFLSGDIINPAIKYPKIDDLTSGKIEEHKLHARNLLATLDCIEEPRSSVYRDFIEENLKQADLVHAMHVYRKAETQEQKDVAASEFMRLNVELYGEPDRQTYHSLLSEKVANLGNKSRSPEAEKIFSELKELLPDEAFDSELATARFRPSKETVEWVENVAQSLYGGLLKHVPNTNEMITSQQLRDICEEIMREEFGEVADDWKVILAQGKSGGISVGSKGKTISVPELRADMSVSEVRGLICHEIGVHVLTAITGESTDIEPLRYGLAGYYETQEGLGKVIEQVLTGGFKEAGVDHYITAGLAYYDHKDFRGAFEAKWRMKLLEDLAPGEVPTEEQIIAAQQIAADGPVIATTRIFRGTDELPLFKDLSYYNGAVDVWKYLEKICGDELQLSLLLAGKISTSKAHQRVILESRSV